ncbi:MAG: cysteine-rich CWC family protein [Solibacillus sp.]
MTIKGHLAKLCPLCQKDNQCGMTANSSTGTCWCFHTSFPKEIFNQLPPDRVEVCICENCLVAFKS